MRYARFTILVMGILISASTFAASKIIQSNTFETVRNLLKNEKSPKSTLLALDDDDTLTMMPCPNHNHCQYIGGPAWFKWQSHLPSNSPERVSATFSGLLGINRILFSLSRMPIVQKDIPSTLALAQERGIKIVAATARGYQMAQATERQFHEDHILHYFLNDSIKTPDDKNTFVGTYLPIGGSRPILYQNGMLYLSGQNKGLMLKDFLKKTHMKHKITHIIFVDDTLKNVQQVASAYQKTPGVNVTCVYYTHLKVHKENFTQGPRATILQATAQKRWDRISAVLEHNLPGMKIAQ